jgi:transcriptional antiterminator NusG
MADFKPGDMVRIQTGAFAAFTGKVEEVYEDDRTLEVAVAIYGRTTPIKLSFEDVEKITFTDGHGTHFSDS